MNGLFGDKAGQKIKQTFLVPGSDGVNLVAGFNCWLRHVGEEGCCPVTGISHDITKLAQRV